MLSRLYAVYTFMVTGKVEYLTYSSLPPTTHIHQEVKKPKSLSEPPKLQHRTHFTMMTLSSLLLLFILTITSTFAQPFDIIEPRQQAPAPPPCIRNGGVTIAQTQQRAEAFASAFVVQKDIRKAFTFIAQDYIVSCNPSLPPSLPSLSLPPIKPQAHNIIFFKTHRTTTPPSPTAHKPPGTCCRPSGPKPR